MMHNAWSHIRYAITYIIHIDWLHIVDTVQAAIIWLMQASLMLLFFVVVARVLEAVTDTDMSTAVIGMVLLLLIMLALYALRLLTARSLPAEKKDTRGGGGNFF